jgi:hypothetical protein
MNLHLIRLVCNESTCLLSHIESIVYLLFICYDICSFELLVDFKSVFWQESESESEEEFERKSKKKRSSSSPLKCLFRLLRYALYVICIF